MATKTINPNQSNSIIDVDCNSSKAIMEKLLASQTKQLTTLHRGQEVEGEVVSITDKEVILDLGAKSEGVISTREIPAATLSGLKIGSKLKAYVNLTENESGQVVLSSSPAMKMEGMKTSSRGSKSINWSKFISAQNYKSKLQGKVLEINKGGLIVEVGGVRGFLPNSQVGFELMSKAGNGLDRMIGENLTVTVIEVDQDNNKLIFSQRGAISDEVKNKLANFQKDQVTKGKIIAVLPFGLVVDVAGTEGLVFISDVSWDRVDDLSQLFSTGQEAEVKVLGLDEELGRLNLSIKQLTQDPFTKIAEKFPVDEVVKGEITGASEAGVFIKLADGVEGLLPSSKIKQGTSYEPGQSMTFLVDSVDSHKRRINLAPFVTSTEGLIYK